MRRALLVAAALACAGCSMQYKNPPAGSPGIADSAASAASSVGPGKAASTPGAK